MQTGVRRAFARVRVVAAGATVHVGLAVIAVFEAVERASAVIVMAALIWAFWPFGICGVIVPFILLVVRSYQFTNAVRDAAKHARGLLSAVEDIKS